MKVLKIIGVVVGVVLLLAGIAYLTRSDPIFMISGKQLSGDEVAYPSDWAFTNDYMTIAVESRPEDPHSVTTICFLHEGDLYIPAQSGSTKTWPKYVVRDPRARIKVGEHVYPVMLERATDLSVDEVAGALSAKYSQFTDQDPADGPPDVWFFRVLSRG